MRLYIPLPVTLIGLGILWFPNVTPSAPTAPDMAIVAAGVASELGSPFGSTFCESDCTTQCLIEHYHENFDNGPANKFNAEPHGCELGESCQHSLCEPEEEREGQLAWTEERMEAVRIAVIEGDVSTLRRLRGEYPERIALSTQRSALQLLGCDGLVIVHIPLVSGLTEALAEK